MECFYLVCPIGLEKYLIRELKHKFTLYFTEKEFNLKVIEKGGIEIECEREIGFSLNFILRTPSKILWRIKTQKCRDLPKLYNIAKKINWKSYFNQSVFQFKITAKKSRIIHTGKMETSLNKAVNDYFQANKIKESVLASYAGRPSPTIFIRLFNDDLTISIDTSGELLHIRKDRAFRGHASIRENIAALLLQRLFTKLPNTAELNLIDPMCGTGTFLFEKFNEFKLQDRAFLFQSFNQNLINNLPILDAQLSGGKINYLGFDLDQEILGHIAPNTMAFEQQDIFDAKPIIGKNIVIINPPYGKKIKIEGNKKNFFKAIFESVQKNYNPIRFGMIIPREYVGNLPGKRLLFKQNGIDVCFLINGIDL
jgi:putative N6-adenine-specific DNA methylase